MDKTESAAENFLAGFSCSQSVLRAFASELGLDPETAARVAAAFGGGMARTGRTCGAVSGALMAIGLRYGSSRPDDTGAKETTYTLARHFLEKFTEQHGSIDCPGLLGCDIGTPEGMHKAREQHMFKTVCPAYVRDAARIAAELVDRENSFPAANG